MKPLLPLCRLGRASGRFGRVAAREDGFSLIEAVASILIVMVFMAASAASLISGYRAVRQTKYFQQGTALGNRAIEETRDISYDALGMLNSDLAGDTEIVGCAALGAGSFYVPGPALACERIVSSDGNVEITNHIQTVPVEGKVFTIRRYVTWVDNEDQGGPEEDYKRVSVVVEWNDNGTTDSFETSTFVSRARRGLPVPEFELTDGTTKEVVPGATVYFNRTIENIGIIDAYDIEVTGPAGWTIDVYNDVGSIGVYELGIDTAITDTNGTGVADTGNVDTDELAHVLIAVTPPGPPATVALSIFDIDLVVTSGVNDAVYKSSLDTPESTTPDRAQVGPLLQNLFLHNNPTPPVGSTASQTDLAMNITQPTAAGSLNIYSTDGSNPDYPGRYLQDLATTPTVTENTALRMVNWVWQPGTAPITFNGSGSLRLWVAPKGLCNQSITLRLYLRQKNSPTTNSAGQTTVLTTVPATVDSPATVGTAGVAPCPFTQVDIPFTLSNVTIPASKWLEVKVVANSISGDHALVAYDTTAYPSKLTLPLVATP